MARHTFEVDDLVTHVARTHAKKTAPGRLLRFRTDHEGFADVDYPDDGVSFDAVSNLRPVPVTADHEGQWARITDDDSGTDERGKRGVIWPITPRDEGKVFITTADGDDYVADPGCAVLVAAPDDAPAPDAAPDEDDDAVREGYPAARFMPTEPDPAPDTTGQQDEADAWAWIGANDTPARFTTSEAQADAWRENGGATRNVVAFRRMRPDDAAQAVADRAEIQRLREEVENVRRALRAESRLHSRTKVDLAVARAQGATSTDGLDLPHVEVRRSTGGYAAYAPAGAELVYISDDASTDFLVQTAAAHVALLRDRLAREAQAPAPDEGRAARIERLHRAVEGLSDEALQEPGTWALDRALASIVWDLLKRHEENPPDHGEETARAELLRAVAPAPVEDTATVDEAARLYEEWRRGIVSVYGAALLTCWDDTGDDVRGVWLAVAAAARRAPGADQTGGATPTTDQEAPRG